MKKLLLLLFFLPISCTHSVDDRFTDNIATSDEDSVIIDDDIVTDAAADIANDTTQDEDITFDEDKSKIAQPI